MTVFQHVVRILRETFLTRDMFCLFLVCVSFALIYNLDIYAGWSVPVIGEGCICSALAFFCLVLFCFKFRLSAYVFLPLILIFHFALLFMQLRYGVKLDEDIVTSILKTNMQEILTFCTFVNVVGCIFLMGISWLICIFGYRCYRQKITWRSILLYGTCYTILIYALSTPAEKTFWHEGNLKKLFYQYTMNRYKHWPFTDYCALYSSVRGYMAHQRLLECTSCAEYDSECSATDNLVVVFHMGESVRADHLSINGYERPTTLKLAQEENLISFPHTTSFATATGTSIVGIFTDAEILERKVKNRAFVDLFNKHDFRTIRITDPYAGKTLDAHVECQTNLENAPLDSQLTQVQGRTTDTLRKALKSHSGKRQLYVIYNNGSHVPYTYPKSAEAFQPSSCNMDNPLERLQETINAYDNTIVDMDSSIKQSIDQLRDIPSVYIYCSDHGEALGEDGKTIHGHAIPSVVSPAIFIWYSDSFAELYPEKVEALWANRNKSISHDHIFHTVLSLACIHSAVIKGGLDLTRPDAVESRRPENLLILKSPYMLQLSGE